MTHHAIETLRANVARLGDSDRRFAESLILQFDKRSSLSVKQWVWVDKLAIRSTGDESPDFDDLGTNTVGNFSGVYQLFAKASAHLKFPRIVLQTPEGVTLVLHRAGAKSKFPGMVNVTDGGRFGSNVWFGRINEAGEWTRGGRVDDGLMSSVATVLARLAADPVGVAAEHGKLTGRCCFCNRPLEDKRSTDIGYGPQCAKKFGLAWGRAAKVQPVATPEAVAA